MTSSWIKRPHFTDFAGALTLHTLIAAPAHSLSLHNVHVCDIWSPVKHVAEREANNRVSNFGVCCIYMYVYLYVCTVSVMHAIIILNVSQNFFHATDHVARMQSVCDCGTRISVRNNPMPYGNSQSLILVLH